MTVRDIIGMLEEISPLAYSEDFDNTGLLVGNEQMEISGILITLDTLEVVVDEAIDKGCNLIVSFHPIIFSGLKKITGKTYVERTVLKAIKNDIAIYSCHTALDNAWNGVNAMICEKLGLTNREILIPQEATIKKLITYVPKNDLKNVRQALFEAGAGNIGNYDNCSFNIEGTGTFKGNDLSSPVIGKKGEMRFESEIQLGVTYKRHLQEAILKALFKAHPYEEVAYEISTLENYNQKIGMGMVGNLKESMDEKEFLNFLKQTMATGCIRHSPLLHKKVSRVAVIGGSGSFAIEAAKRARAQMFVSADFKYHDFFRAEKALVLADVGHYESEQYTKDLLFSFLTKKITNFAPALPKGIVISEIITNPISYV